MSTEWKKNIAMAFAVKERIAEVDSNNLWPLYYPELAASDEEVRAVENLLGFPLPTEYREFLSCANGWQCFYQVVDFFGTYDLLGSKRMVHARECITWLEADGVLPEDHSDVQLLPVGQSREDNTLFCLATPLHPNPGFVYWFSGRLVDSFPDFKECFLALCDYNRLEIGYLLDDSQSGESRRS